MNRRRKYRIACVALILALCASWGMWSWGRNQDFWGTPDRISQLSGNDVFHPKNGRISSHLVTRSEHRRFLGKTKPQWVLMGIGIPNNSELEPTVARVSTELRNIASAQGWSLEESCAPYLLWCARILDDSGHTLFMTVSETPDVELNSSERSTKLSEGITNADVIFARLQYLS